MSEEELEKLVDSIHYYVTDNLPLVLCPWSRGCLCVNRYSVLSEVLAFWI